MTFSPAHLVDNLDLIVEASKIDAKEEKREDCQPWKSEPCLDETAADPGEIGTNHTTYIFYFRWLKEAAVIFPSVLQYAVNT